MEATYRVILVHRDRYLVRNEEEELFCVLSGSLRYREEYPVVGDYVEITVNPYGDSLIQAIRPRRTAFFRPDRGGHADGFVKTLQVQPLIANIDYVFIITSLNQDFSLNRIARYAAMTVSGGAIPVAVLTKADLCPNADEMEEKVKELSKELQAVSISSYTGFGLETGFWCNMPENTDRQIRTLRHDSETLHRDKPEDASAAYSIRCVMD